MMPRVTTADIAAALGISGSYVRERAVKEGWKALGRACPGGIIYDRNSLPPALLHKVVNKSANANKRDDAAFLDECADEALALLLLVYCCKLERMTLALHEARS